MRGTKVNKPTGNEQRQLFRELKSKTNVEGENE